MSFVVAGLEDNREHGKWNLHLADFFTGLGPFCLFLFHRTQTCTCERQVEGSFEGQVASVSLYERLVTPRGSLSLIIIIIII